MVQASLEAKAKARDTHAFRSTNDRYNSNSHCGILVGQGLALGYLFRR